MAKDLKSEYRIHLRVFVVVHVAIAWSMVTLGALDLTGANSLMEKLLAKGGVAAGLLPIVTLVLNGWVKSSYKEVLVFWRTREALPGHRAFTELAPGDSRIDLQRLEASHGVLPTEPEEQNRLWYRLHRKHEERPELRGAHRDYLLARDLTAMGFFLIFAGVAVVAWAGLWSRGGAYYFVALVVEYLVLATAGRHYGERLVCNVLAVEGAGP
jgi:hypothetical protein